MLVMAAAVIERLDLSIPLRSVSNKDTDFSRVQAKDTPRVNKDLTEEETAEAQGLLGGGEEEEIPEDLAELSPEEQQAQIKFRSAWMMTLGTVLVLLFSDPMVALYHAFFFQPNGGALSCLLFPTQWWGSIMPSFSDPMVGLYHAFFFRPNGGALSAQWHFCHAQCVCSIMLSVCVLYHAHALSCAVVLYHASDSIHREDHAAGCWDRMLHCSAVLL